MKKKKLLYLPVQYADVAHEFDTRDGLDVVILVDLDNEGTTSLYFDDPGLWGKVCSLFESDEIAFTSVPGERYPLLKLNLPHDLVVQRLLQTYKLQRSI